eukprot:TRINITY_DN249_c0_g1_i3.p1 TRINITY_DN249_c0_g1~~TRINITY_DN249_c0_g1_i3.p1  ORF type:complete len:362 (-),score=89.10 TRINITY_DN249_c0_g1_i3:166-1251(-)
MKQNTIIVIVAILAGLCFGTALHKSGVHRVEVLRDQFDFHRFVMLKVFCAAGATSAFCLAILDFIQPKKVESSAAFAYDFSFGLLPTIVGTFLLGMGMTIGGSCPGTVWAQLGSGSFKTLFTIGGAFVATFIFGILADHKVFENFNKVFTLKKQMLYDIVETPKWVLRIVVGIAMMGVAIGAEIYDSWGEDIMDSDNITVPGNGLGKWYWFPIFCGVILGAGQIFVTVVLGQNLGSSMAFCSMVGALFFWTDRFAYIKKYREQGLKFWWQTIYLVAAALASFLCYQTSDEYLNASEGRYKGDDFHAIEGFIGGFLILFGARLAAGCSSGHGISGVGQLCLRSFVAVCSMFIGAIVTKVIFY